MATKKTKTATKAERFSACTILRICRVREYAGLADPMHLVADEIAEKPCGTPLFGNGAERATGICDSCAQGWSDKESSFAGSEGRRALEEGVRRGFFDLGSGKLSRVAWRAGGHKLTLEKRLEAQRARKAFGLEVFSDGEFRPVIECGKALRFATREDADRYAAGLYAGVRIGGRRVSWRVTTPKK